MKKYNTPILNEEVIELEDVIAESIGGAQAGDTNSSFWDGEVQ